MNVGVNYVGRPEGAEATKETPGVWGHPGPADTERFRGAMSTRRTRERSTHPALAVSALIEAVQLLVVDTIHRL